MLLSQNTFTVKRLLKEPLTIELSPETLAIAADSSGVGNLSNAEFGVRVLKDGKELFPNCEENVEGRNYLFNSGNFKDLSMWSVYTYCSASLYGNLIRVIAQNNSYARYCQKTLIPLTDSVQNFVVSIEYISAAEIVTLNSKNSNSLTEFNESGGAADGTFTHLQTQVLDGNRKRGIFKWATIIKGTALSSFLLIRIPANATVDIVNIKAEKGDIPTDYTPAPEDLLNSATITTNKCTAVVIDDTVKITTLTPGNDAGWVDVEMAYGSLSAKKRFTWALAKSGVSISNIDVEYAVNTSTTVAPTTGWATTAPAITGSQQLWTRTKTTYSTGSPTYSTPANITPKIGKGVVSIIEEYYLSTSKTTQTGGSWVTSPPAWSSGKYLWTRSKITYSNPTSTDYTTPVVSSEWEAINNIEIGGRNLLLNSDLKGIPYRYDHINKSGEGGLQLSTLGFSEPIIQPHQYTISMEIRGVSDVNIILYRLSAQGNSTLTLIRNTDLTEEYKKVELTFTPHQAQLTDLLVYTLYRATAYNAWFEIKPNSIKLEKGNKATDWTPAPEDVENKFDDIVGNYNLIVDSLVNATSNIYGFAFRYVLVEQGTVYTFSANGRCNNVSSGKKLRVYIHTDNWSYGHYIDITSTNDTTSSVSFTALESGTLLISAYYYDDSAGRDGTVTVNWYKLEVGNKATAWRGTPTDVPVAVKYLNEALMPDNITPVGTDIGLLFSKIIQMRDTLGNVHSGMSGLAGDNIGFWAGGTYADALAGLAKIILRKDGSGQLAGGGIKWDALASLVEFIGKITATSGKVGGFNIQSNRLSNTNIEFSDEALPSLSSLLAANSVSINRQSSWTGYNTTQYEEALATTQNITFSFNALLRFKITTETLYNRAPRWIVSIINNSGTIVFQKNGYSNITSKEFSLPLSPGTYRIEAVVSDTYNYGETVADVCQILGHSNENIITANTDVSKTKIGNNGLFSFWETTKYLYYSAAHGLEYKGTMNLPGVLAAGSVGANGSHDRKWGAKVASAGQLITMQDTIIYVIPHNIGHTSYSAQATATEHSRVAYVYERNANNIKIAVRNLSGTNVLAQFDYLLIGSN